jgi:hypothetical protein
MIRAQVQSCRDRAAVRDANNPVMMLSPGFTPGLVSFSPSGTDCGLKSRQQMTMESVYVDTTEVVS